MDNWYILRVKFEMPEGCPDEFYYEAIEWHDAEPPRTDMDIEWDNGDGIEAGNFEIVASALTEEQAEKFLEKVDQTAKANQ